MSTAPHHHDRLRGARDDGDHHPPGRRPRPAAHRDQELTVHSAQTRVTTPQAARFLAAFCRHAEAMTTAKAQHLHGAGRPRPQVLDVRWSGDDGTVTFDWGRCTLQATAEALTVHLECPTGDRLQALEDLLTADLERFGRREGLSPTWH